MPGLHERGVTASRFPGLTTGARVVALTRLGEYRDISARADRKKTVTRRHCAERMPQLPAGGDGVIVFIFLVRCSPICSVRPTYIRS